MAVKLLAVLFSCFLFLGVGGCATGRRQSDLEIQGLKNQVSLLEAQLQSKDEEIGGLKDSLGKMQQAEPSAQEAGLRVIPEVKSRPNVRQIQTALTNAGYDPGSIDGKMGRKTKDAIRAFQRANSLPVDGKVGRKTWKALMQYLYKKEK